MGLSICGYWRPGSLQLEGSPLSQPATVPERNLEEAFPHRAAGWSSLWRHAFSRGAAESPVPVPSVALETNQCGSHSGRALTFAGGAGTYTAGGSSPASTSSRPGRDGSGICNPNPTSPFNSGKQVLNSLHSTKTCFMQSLHHATPSPPPAQIFPEEGLFQTKGNVCKQGQLLALTTRSTCGGRLRSAGARGTEGAGSELAQVRPGPRASETTWSCCTGGSVNSRMEGPRFGCSELEHILKARKQTNEKGVRGE